MKKAMTISYEVGNNLYINLTNKCPCACTFCIRTHADGAYVSDPLWLEHEPSLGEIFDDLSKRDLAKYDEIVFCGYGEPTERIGDVIVVAKALRMLPECPKLRINTNGLGDLINARSAAPDPANAPSRRPQHPKKPDRPRRPPQPPGRRGAPLRCYGHGISKPQRRHA